jgi:hypothetical protein
MKNSEPDILGFFWLLGVSSAEELVYWKMEYCMISLIHRTRKKLTKIYRKREQKVITKGNGRRMGG